tara:strand:- start:414 stop:632 length:219 start_codon:yes stop_codon:yes gene_type:complete
MTRKSVFFCAFLGQVTLMKIPFRLRRILKRAAQKTHQIFIHARRKRTEKPQTNENNNAPKLQRRIVLLKLPL